MSISLSDAANQICVCSCAGGMATVSPVAKVQGASMAIHQYSQGNLIHEGCGGVVRFDLCCTFPLQFGLPRSRETRMDARLTGAGNIDVELRKVSCVSCGDQIRYLNPYRC